MVWASLNSMTFILPSVNWEAVLTNIYIKPISSGIDITKTNYNTTQSTKIYVAGLVTKGIKVFHAFIGQIEKYKNISCIHL